MVFPLLVSMILMMAYNLVDSIWVGNLLGEQGYAALTSGTSIILILNSIAMGAGNGISIQISQAVGAGEKKKANGIIITAMLLGVVFSLSVVILFEVFMGNVIRMLKTPTEIFALSKDYLSIYMIGYVAFFAYMLFTSVFRSFGDAVLQVKGMVCSTVLNAIIDPIMIHWMGLKGAAWATVISETFCFCFAYCYYKKKKIFQMKIKEASFTFVKPLMKTTIPSALQQCMPAISSAAMLIFIGNLGVTTIAAYGVATKLEVFLFYPAMAMNMALTVIVGQCKGAGRIDKVKEYTKNAVIIGCIFLAILSILVITCAVPLSKLFVDSSGVSEMVKTFLHIVSVGYVLYMFTNSIMGALSGLGKPVFAMLLMFVYYVGIRIPLAGICVHTPLAFRGICIAILVSHILAAFIAAYMMQRVYKMEQ